MSNGPDFDTGTPGASARREGERRKSSQSWETGAEGEEALAASLARRCSNVVVLHDRRMPGTRANIDHLAIAPSGVHVIDAKRYRGKIEVRKPLFGEPKLTIAGRNQAKLVESLSRQVDAVQAALEEIAPATPIHGCFCFINPAGPLAASDLPWLRTLSIDGYALLYPRKLTKRLNRPGPLNKTEATRIAQALDTRFPPA
jgi:Nuclease-related domain